MIVLGTLAPYAFEIAALTHLSATTTGIVGMIEPVLAATVAWIWLDQGLGAVQVAGGLIVLVAVVLVQLSGTDPAASTPTWRPMPPSVDLLGQHRSCNPVATEAR